jgi:mRNA interferase RelE/StbE
MEIRYDKEALKYLQKLQKKLRDMINNAINDLTKTPPLGDRTPVQGYKDGRYRLRVGKYRVIYRYSKDTKEEDGEIIKIDILIVMEVGSRGDIYK